jgi:hypothetical protein
MKTDFKCSLYLESLIGVYVVGVGGGTLGRAPSEESLDKFTRLSGFSNFMECNRGGWTLDISTGCIESKCPILPWREQPELAFIITKANLKNGPINLA